MTEKIKMGKVKFETYEMELEWDDVVDLAKHFQNNSVGAVIKVTIGDQTFDC